MFIPIGDEPRLRGSSVLTYALIGLNVAVYVLVTLPLAARAADPSDPLLGPYVHDVLLPRIAERMGTTVDMLRMGRDYAEVVARLVQQTSAYDLLIYRFGFRPVDPNLLDLFASMFLHANFAHLAGNMLFLWIYGRNVEVQAGRLGFVAIYLLTGVAAVALYALFQLGSGVPMIGASGAISGVLGVYFLWFPRNKVRVLVWLFFFVQVFALPARWVLGFFILVDNLMPFLFGASATGVAYGAHIGGFAGGLGAAFLVQRWQTRTGVVKQARAAGEEAVRELFGGGTPASPGEAFHRAVGRSQWQAALKLYTDLPARARLQLAEPDLLELADWLSDCGQTEAALAILQRLLATRPRSPLLPQVHLRIGALHLREQRIPAAYQHFLTVLDLGASAEEKAAARAGLQAVEEQVRAARRFKLE
jgi:membrane associated rhomboid family serine protease